jgi:hypothetical protein
VEARWCLARWCLALAMHENVLGLCVCCCLLRCLGALVVRPCTRSPGSI